MENQADLKSKVESLLFCLPQGIEIEKIAKKLKLDSPAVVAQILSELQKDYAERKSGMQLMNENNIWKFKIPDEHTNLVKELAEPEFDKSILQTLAYIAWRGGARQCDTVRVRSNKAYNHIKLLLEKGYIESHRSGLSKWLEPTKKFYEYFNIDKGQKLPVPVPEAKQEEQIPAEITEVKEEHIQTEEKKEE